MDLTPHAHGMVGVLPETLAGALAYFVLPVPIFLFVSPYSRSRFVRFHSFQCLGACLAAVVLIAFLRIAGLLLYSIPSIGHLMVWLLSMVAGLALFTVWAVLVVKALQGEAFKLPIVGSLAEQQAAK